MEMLSIDIVGLIGACSYALDCIEAELVIITNKQKAVKIPTGIRMLVRRCCNAVLRLEKFEGSAEISVTFTDNEGIKALNRGVDRKSVV